MKKCSHRPSIGNHKEKRAIARKTKNGVSAIIYGGQTTRSKTRGHRPPEYSLIEFREWLYSQTKFHELYSEWVNSGYKKRLKPSVDRKHDDIHYCMSNIQLMTWEENNKKSHIGCRERKFYKGHQTIQQLQQDGTIIEDFISQSEASRITGISKGSIWKVLEGKRKTAGGFKWQRKNLEN